ncbi:aconitase subunit 1 [Marinicauda salina]|uniref:Aconitase subunit 1 n=1 Tax=Marinicauda salina TaxID=2135793 RepID=A0A2U2BUZ3_9PROT|nr:aconitase X [Marinicauda salina]PWE17800.1 aconitase subunit 1 [Marinicauda salina]
MTRVELSERDRRALAGDFGAAEAWAMDLVTAAADALEAETLTDIEGAHLVGAYHSGPANLGLLERLAAAGGRVRVPTTLSASSADLHADGPACYRGAERENARAVVEPLLRLGCRPVLTCAPYFLDARPRFGQRLAWAESNAVLFANSAIGARTLKTPQYLDLACALTGRAPLASVLTDAGRRPDAVVDAAGLSGRWFDDDVGYELVGFRLGTLCGARIPLLRGLPQRPDELALRSICAAAGVTGQMPLIHVEGATPEARAFASGGEFRQLDDASLRLDDAALKRAAAELRPGDPGAAVGAICLGAPHLGEADLRRLEAALPQRPLAAPIYASTPRDLYARLHAEGLVRELEARGVRFVRDACTYYGPLASATSGLVLSNSAKWAAYAPGNIGVRSGLATLEECVAAAVTGRYEPDRSYWNG